jgi:hypothetical protein
MDALEAPRRNITLTGQRWTVRWVDPDGTNSMGKRHCQRMADTESRWLTPRRANYERRTHMPHRNVDSQSIHAGLSIYTWRDVLFDFTCLLMQESTGIMLLRLDDCRRIDEALALATPTVTSGCFDGASMVSKMNGRAPYSSGESDGISRQFILPNALDVAGTICMN